METPPRRILLRAVRILLECILVFYESVWKRFRFSSDIIKSLGVDSAEGPADEDATGGGVPERRAGPGPIPGRVGQVPGPREEEGRGGPGEGERSGSKYTDSRL